MSIDLFGDGPRLLYAGIELKSFGTCHPGPCIHFLTPFYAFNLIHKWRAFLEHTITLFSSGDMKSIPFLGFGNNLLRKSFAPNRNVFRPYPFADQPIIPNGFQYSLLMALSPGLLVAQTEKFNKPIDIKQA